MQIRSGHLRQPLIGFGNDANKVWANTSSERWEISLSRGGKVNFKLITFARLRRLVLRTSAESGSTPPGPAWCGKGGPPASPLGEDRSFFLTSMGPADEAEGPDIASETSTLSPPVAPEEEEEDEDEEPASDFLLESIMEDVGGLSWSQEVQRVNKRQQTEMTEITSMANVE